MKKISLYEYFKINRQSIGVVLILCGMQLGTVIRNILPSIEVVNLLLALGVIFLIDFKNILQGKLVVNNILIFVFIVQVFFIIYALLCGTGTSQLYTFHIFIAALVLIISFRSHYVDFTNFNKILFYISGFIAICICYFATNGFREIVLTYEGTAKFWMKEGGDPITMSRVLVIALISCLVYKSDNIVERIIKFIIIISACIGLFSFMNRATILGIIACLSIYIYKSLHTGKLLVVNKNKFVKYIIILYISIVATYILYNTNYYIQEKINWFFSSSINGIKSFINNTGGDVSGNTRYYLRLYALSNYSREFSLRTLLFGVGYSNKYLDMPILQIFIDNGIIIGGIYFYCLIIIPLKYVIKVKNTDTNIFTVSLIFIQSLMDQLYCGLPYYFFFWTPILIVMIFEINKKKYITI